MTKGPLMDDTTLLSQIEKLSNEEQELEESHVGEPLTGEGLARLKAVEVQLDQCYDLLRQRRARRSAGLDPDDATLRKETVVENYLQ
jgi:hypothetical protein